MPQIIVKNADYSALGFGKLPTLEANYQQETKDIIDANILASLNTDANKAVYKEALNNFIRKAKNDGFWDKMDYLFVPWLSQTKSEAQYNLKTGLSVSDMYYQQDTWSEVNWGLRHKETPTNTDGSAKAGIQLPFSWNYDYENMHVAFYHNDLGSYTGGSAILRAVSEQPNLPTINNNCWYALNIRDTPDISSYLGAANDANRKTMVGFDTNFASESKKLIAINTVTDGLNVTARSVITGNDIGGEFSEIDVTGFFDGIVDKSHVQIMQGQYSQYKCNTCVISLGTGMTALDYTNYRAACDAMNQELLGTIPTFPVY